MLTILTRKSTTHFKLHLNTCQKIKNQKSRLDFSLASISQETRNDPATVNGKFNINKMKEAVTH